MTGLTLADLVANGTMSSDIAATLRATASGRHSFVVCAIPRLAGKSTVMGAMLAHAPKGAAVKTVGDDGVVWHSIDAGNNWERQPTGVRASLRSVHFLNPYTGWIAGREELPHNGGSSGVLLFTVDGGLKWQKGPLNERRYSRCVRVPALC